MIVTLASGISSVSHAQAIENECTIFASFPIQFMSFRQIYICSTSAPNNRTSTEWLKHSQSVVEKEKNKHDDVVTSVHLFTFQRSSSYNSYSIFLFFILHSFILFAVQNLLKLNTNEQMVKLYPIIKKRRNCKRKLDTCIHYTLYRLH